MRAGAADYLIKDRLGRLGESVRHALEQRRLREEHAAARTAIVAMNADLEMRIASRTAQLKVANHALEAELGQRKRAEEELRRLNGLLEERVMERTQRFGRVEPSATGAGYRTDARGTTGAQAAGVRAARLPRADVGAGSHEGGPTPTQNLARAGKTTTHRGGRRSLPESGRVHQIHSWPS